MMKQKRLSSRSPHDPEVLRQVQEKLRTMPLEELDALLNYRKDGVEETNMFEVLAEYDRKQQEKRDAERAA